MSNLYRVTLTDRPDPVLADVKYLDMCVAEREAPKHGIPGDPSLTPLSLSLVWVWCALRRAGEGVGDFPHFRDVLLDDLEPVRQAVAADPTQPGDSTGSP